RVATVAAAPVGGLAVAVGGPAAGFGVAGVLFAVSLVLLMAVRVRELAPDEEAGTSETARHQLVGGLRYIRGHRVLAPLLLVAAVTELGFAGPANIGVVLLADERGWGAAGMAWTMGGFGVGAGAAALLLAVRGRIARAGAVQSWGVVAGAVALGAIGFAPSVAVAAVAGLCVGLCTGLGGALIGALVQTVTEPAYLGRVTSVVTLFTVGIAPMTFPVVGAAIGAWGVEPVFAASAAMSAAGGVLGLCSRALRRAELPTAPPRP
ncbi:MFS transporter, partial [Streptomyces rectiviolaceus]|uniref:MFS transporter n=1 Tax=Streptomyces rectiviolaceus TaxID=332591 RepID=UPI0031DB0304